MQYMLYFFRYRQGNIYSVSSDLQRFVLLKGLKIICRNIFCAVQQRRDSSSLCENFRKKIPRDSRSRWKLNESCIKKSACRIFIIFRRRHTNYLTLQTPKAIIVPHRIITKLVHWPLMGGLLHLVQQEGAWAGCSTLLVVSDVRAHPSVASLPVSVLLSDGPLLWGLNVANT